MKQYFNDNEANQQQTHDPFSFVRLKTRKGSDFPKKSFLSSLLAANCSVTSSWAIVNSSKIIQEHVFITRLTAYKHLTATKRALDTAHYLRHMQSRLGRQTSVNVTIPSLLPKQRQT